MAKTVTPYMEVEKVFSKLKYGFQGAERIEERLSDILQSSRGIIREECMHMLISGGKRLRPMLVILNGQCFSNINDSLIDAAAAAELIHMASLVHDDIIDNSRSRRGKSTVNSVFGNHAAVLAGDFMFAKSFEILSGLSDMRCMKFMVSAIAEMTIGEVNQADDMFNACISDSRYYERIREKTGMLLSSCCGAGAAIGGASEREINLLREFGMNIGYAFQIIDDILDFTGNADLLGKPVGGDLMSGIITLPVILLLQGGRFQDVRNIIEKGHINSGEFSYIKECLIDSGSMERAYETAEMFCERAKLCLSGIRSSSCRENLMEIADKITDRKV